MNNVRTSDLLSVVVFVVAVLVRGALQMFGGPEVGDVSWVTTFAAIAASWVGITGRLGVVEKNTNGKSDAERTAIAREAAEHALDKAGVSPTTEQE